MAQDIIDAIYNQFPWASEVTMEQVNSELTNNNVTMGSIVAVLSKNDAAAVRDLAPKAQSASETAEKVGRRVLKSGKIANAHLNKILSSGDPANAVAELSHESAKLLANAGIGLSNYTSGLGKIGAGFGLIAKTAGTGLVVATGMGVIFAKLLTEQEKQTRQLVEFGAIVADQGYWTDLRATTRSLGMGLKEFVDLGEAAKPMIVSSQGDAFRGMYALSNFLDDVDQDKTFRDYGLGIQDQSRFLAQEIETLYQLGIISDLNAHSKKRVIDSYKSANNLALFTASTLGVQRSEALRIRDEARNNIELQAALLQNKEFIDTEYGDAARANIDKANGLLAILNTAIFGEDFAGNMKKYLGGFVGDIKWDQEAENNIAQATIEMLNVGGAELSNAYINIIEKAGKGEYSSEADLMKDYRVFFDILEQSMPKIAGSNEDILAYNDLVHAAVLAPDAFKFADLTTLEGGEYFGLFSDKADSSIETMNDMAIAFQNMQELITPGFDTVGTGFKTLTGSLLKFGKGVSKLFGGEERYDSMYKKHLDRANETRLALITEKNIEANIAIVAMQKDNLEAEIEKIQKLKKSDVIPEGAEGAGDILTEEHHFALDQQISQLQTDLQEVTKYQTDLLEKEKELLVKESTP